MKSPQFSISELALRANPRYELVLFDRLPSEQREMLKDFRKDPDFYGVLRPLDESGLGAKSVSRDIALLYLTLQQPGKVPEYVRDRLGEQCNQEISRLVLDGVLTVEKDGKFLCGADAAELIDAGNEEPSAFAEARKDFWSASRWKRFATDRRWASRTV